MSTRERRGPSLPLGVDFSGLGPEPLAELGLFVGAASRAELDERLRAEAAAFVDRVLAALNECDAFDVIELMRMRALPLAPELALDPNYDGSASAIELVTLVLLTRGHRCSPDSDRQGSRPNQLINEMHEQAKRLVRLSSYRTLFASQLSDQAALARLAAEYQSFFVGVRSHQYDSVEEEHEAALFDRPDSDDLLTRHLGFTRQEFVLVRDAIQTLYSDAMTELRDRTAGLFLATQAEQRDPTDQERAEFRRDMIDFMFLPGDRAAVTPAAITDLTQVPRAKVDAVLSAFSIRFDLSVDPVDRVMAYLRGLNPLHATSLVRDDDAFLMTTGAIGTDAFRVVAEGALKADQSAWRRYDQKIRKIVSEDLAVELVKRALRSDPAAAPIEYVAPKPGDSPSSVDSACIDPLRLGDLTEGDALFVIDDVAICVEVKGRTIANAARQGDLPRFEREVKNTLGSGAGQARRLESLIISNGGVWLKDGSWLDLSAVQEIHTIVIGLDTFGPLAVSLGDLDAASLFGTSGTIPWIASIHDLDVISRVIDRPSEFLLYLRRRTERGIASNYRGCDELDLFMLFMGGGLYVEPDPDEVHRQHPNTPIPRRQERRQHREQARPTLVGTFTDDLDRWMYWVEGSALEPAPKPRFNSHESADQLVDLMQDGRAPGRLRFGADLLALSGEAQAQLGNAIDQMIEASRSDHGFHTLAQGYAGNAGYPTFFAACISPLMSNDEGLKRLLLYMRAKKHQMGSDRSMGLLFSDTGEVVAGLYLNDPPGSDPELDQLGQILGLQETWKRRSIPNPANRDRGRRKKAKKRKRRK